MDSLWKVAIALCLVFLCFHATLANPAALFKTSAIIPLLTPHALLDYVLMMSQISMLCICWYSINNGLIYKNKSNVVIIIKTNPLFILPDKKRPAYLNCSLVV